MAAARLAPAPSPDAERLQSLIDVAADLTELQPFEREAELFEDLAEGAVDRLDDVVTAERCERLRVVASLALPEAWWRIDVLVLPSKSVPRQARVRVEAMMLRWISLVPRGDRRADGGQVQLFEAAVQSWRGVTPARAGRAAREC